MGSNDFERADRESNISARERDKNSKQNLVADWINSIRIEIQPVLRRLIKNYREYVTAYPGNQFAGRGSSIRSATRNLATSKPLGSDLSSRVSFARDNRDYLDNLNQRGKDLLFPSLPPTLFDPTQVDWFLCFRPGPGVAVVQMVEEHRQREAHQGPSTLQAAQRIVSTSRGSNVARSRRKFSQPIRRNGQTASRRGHIFCFYSRFAKITQAGKL